MDFAPSPGRVELLSLPSGPGLRFDRGVETGDMIPPEFDSMIAKVIALGRDRGEAIARLRRALRETTALIEDGSTNRGFLLRLLEHPDVAAGSVDTTWLDRHRIGADADRLAHADVAVLQAVIELGEKRGCRRPGALLRLRPTRAARGPRRGGPHRRSRLRGQGYRFRVLQVAPGCSRVTVDGATVRWKSNSSARTSAGWPRAAAATGR